MRGWIGGWFLGWVTYVEARDDTVERSSTVGVGRPHTAQPGAVVGYEGLVGSVSYGRPINLAPSTSSGIAVRHTLRSWPKVPLMVMFFSATRSPKDTFGSLPANEL